MTTTLVPPMALDLDALLPALPKPRNPWPDYPEWIGDGGERILWKRLWTTADGERTRRPAEGELEAFPEVVRLVREALAADQKMTRATFDGNGADYLLAEIQFFRAHDAVRVLVKSTGYPAKFLMNILNERPRTFPTKHRKPTESHEEFTARYNAVIESHRAAGLPVRWSEDM